MNPGTSIKRKYLCLQETSYFFQNGAFQYISCRLQSLLRVIDGIIHVEEVVNIIRDSGFNAERLPFQMFSLQNCRRDVAGSLDCRKCIKSLLTKAIHSFRSRMLVFEHRIQITKH